MTPISLMPPVASCSSCEGQKAQDQALQVGEARAKQIELRSEVDAATPSAPGAQAGGAVPADERTKPLNGAVPALLSLDLAVQASLARPSIAAPGDEADALRLRSRQAYGGV